MTERSGAAPEPISVDQLTEAVTNGVLRALSAQRTAENSPVSVAKMIADRGIFSQIIVTCGSWPTGKEPPLIDGGVPSTIVAGGGQGTPP